MTGILITALAAARLSLALLGALAAGQPVPAGARGSPLAPPRHEDFRADADTPAAAG